MLLITFVWLDKTEVKACLQVGDGAINSYCQHLHFNFFTNFKTTINSNTYSPAYFQLFCSLHNREQKYWSFQNVIKQPILFRHLPEYSQKCFLSPDQPRTFQIEFIKWLFSLVFFWLTAYTRGCVLCCMLRNNSILISRSINKILFEHQTIISFVSLFIIRKQLINFHFWAVFFL